MDITAECEVECQKATSVSIGTTEGPQDVDPEASGVSINMTMLPPTGLFFAGRSSVPSSVPPLSTAPGPSSIPGPSLDPSNPSSSAAFMDTCPDGEPCFESHQQSSMTYAPATYEPNVPTHAMSQSHYACYDFNTLALKQAPTLSDITLSLLPSPTITLSYLPVYFYPYIGLSSRPSPISPYVTLSLHFITDHSASDNLSRGHSIQIVYPSSIPILSSLLSIPL